MTQEALAAEVASTIAAATGLIDRGANIVMGWRF